MAAASIAISQIRSISITSRWPQSSLVLQAVIGSRRPGLHHSDQRSPPRS
jgi:hypothetical protein